MLVDGNQMFNRPGPRLVEALQFCEALVRAAAEAKDAGGALDLGARAEEIPAGFPWEML